MASSESPAMKREREIVAELAVHNENLGTVRDEMNALSDRLRELRAQEGAIQDVIMQLEFEVCLGRWTLPPCGWRRHTCRRPPHRYTGIVHV